MTKSKLITALRSRESHGFKNKLQTFFDAICATESAEGRLGGGTAYLQIERKLLGFIEEHINEVAPEIAKIAAPERDLLELVQTLHNDYDIYAKDLLSRPSGWGDKITERKKSWNDNFGRKKQYFEDQFRISYLTKKLKEKSGLRRSITLLLIGAAFGTLASNFIKIIDFMQSIILSITN